MLTPDILLRAYKLMVTARAMADTYDVISMNGIAIVSAKDGLYQYDYRDISNIKLLSKISLQQ